MKKIITLALIFTLLTLVFASCTTQPAESETSSSSSSSSSSVSESEAEPTAEPVDVSIVALGGPTSMGMVHFMDGVDNGEITTNNYNFEIESAIDVVNTQLVTGEVDIAAVPSNVASVLYNNTEGKLQVLALNTLGVLYIVENGETVQSIEDLRGKTIYAAGSGATPEFALNKILEANGLSDEVSIEWKTEQNEVLATVVAEENAIAMLPQPFVTTAQMSNESLRVALDLTEIWDNSEIDGTLITGVVVANKEFVEQNPEVIADFMANYETSVNFVNDNVDEGAALVVKYGILPQEPIAAAAIPHCNINFIYGEEMKTLLSGYLQVLFDQNPASVGGAMPDDGFYYSN